MVRLFDKKGRDRRVCVGQDGIRCRCWAGCRQEGRDGVGKEEREGDDLLATGHYSTYSTRLCRADP